MNGNWYPWGTTHTTPADFVAAWRRIHNLFGQAGVSNVTWVWNPNDIFPVPQVQLKPYFPGNAYLAGALWLAGSDYLVAVKSTTTARQHGSTPIIVLLKDCLLWGALPFALAVIGSVTYAMQPRTEPGEQIAPPGSRVHRIVLGVVLTGTALLAPLDQIHLHTDVSFQKHIGFGLFFAAPMAGIGLARIVGAHFHRAQFGVVVWAAACCSAWCRPVTSTSPGPAPGRWSPSSPVTWRRGRTTWSRCPRYRRIT